MLRSRQTEGNVLISILLVICWTLVGLRVYVRTRLSKCFGSDDWLLLVALVCYTVYSASALAAVFHGVGLDPKLIPQADFPYAVMFWWLASLFYNLSTLFVKLSVSIFIHKLCPQRIHKFIIWGMMSIVISYAITYFFLTIFQCSPPNYFWLKFAGLKNGKCINEQIIPLATYAHSGISAMADWTLGLLPIWLIWGLQMNQRTKISIVILLGLGILAGVAAIIRIPYVRVLGDDKKLFLYNIVDVSIWSLLEAALGIIAASCSALRPLFKKFYQLTTSGSRSKSHSKSHTFASKFRSKSNTHNRSFGMGGLRSSHAGYNTELRSNPSQVGGRNGGGTIGSKSEVRIGKNNERTFYKSDDESSLELGLSPVDRNGTNSGGVIIETGSEENLTRPERDIHVHTLVEVVSGRHGQ